METFNPFRFDGRLGRLQYFGYAVIWCLIMFVVALFIGLQEELAGPGAAATGSLMYLVLMIVYAIATVSYGVRRLHDFDKSGWWYLLLFVPIANLVMGLVLLFAPGTQGANRYGLRDGHGTAASSA